MAVEIRKHYVLAYDDHDDLIGCFTERVLARDSDFKICGKKLGSPQGKLYNYRLPFVKINYDAIPVAPIRRSLSKFLDVIQHQDLGPVLGTQEGDRCFHGEVLCVRTDQRGRGLGKIIVEKTIEMARNKGAKYFDVTSVNQFTKAILEKFSFKGRYLFQMTVFPRIHMIKVPKSNIFVTLC